MLKQEMLYEVQLWGCVSALLGLPAELIPHIFGWCLATLVIIPAGRAVVNTQFEKVCKNKKALPGTEPGRARNKVRMG